MALRKENDEDKKNTMRMKLLEETLPTGLVCDFLKTVKKLEEMTLKAQLESRLVERGGQYFVGNNITWADLHLQFLVSVIRENHAQVRTFQKYLVLLISFQLLDGCPKIQNLVERIEELPNISNWLKSRPESDFDAVIKAF